jgi:type III secretory pathway component EscT
VPIVTDVARAFEASGVDLAALGLAWARVSPTVAIVPAFGLRALPAPARGVLGVMLALCIYPAVAPVAASSPGVPWPVLALGEIVRGLPVAIAAAVPLWAATMAGGAADSLRNNQDMRDAPVVEGKSSPLGVPLSILASAIFLFTGGPARVVSVLARGDFPAHPLAAMAQDVSGGITLAVALAAPVLAASIVVEISAALVARAASPAQIHALLSPLRAFAILAVFALAFDRIAVAMAHAI